MKLNKTIALVALVAGGMIAGSALQAQDSTNTPPPNVRPGGGAGMRARPNIEQLAKDLNLSDDQKAKLKTALDEQMKKMQELRADTSLSQEDRRAKMKEMRDDLTAKVKEILTADQFEKWQKTMQQRRPQGGPGASAAPAGDKPAAGADTAPKN
jgi:Spy/CpxP family protein refolding chaperone